MTDIENKMLVEIRRITALASDYPVGSVGRDVCEREAAASTAALVAGDEAAMQVRLGVMASMRRTAA